MWIMLIVLGFHYTTNGSTIEIPLKNIGLPNGASFISTQLYKQWWLVGLPQYFFISFSLG